MSRHAVRRYLNAMAIEAGQRAGAAQGIEFSSVFFGGGTPSTLEPGAFRALWRTLRDHFAIAADAEITLEANPESVLADRVTAWTEAGVNRVSMGAQSFDPNELQQLGRIHDSARPAEAARRLRAGGIERVSLDLMYGYPGNTLSTWQSSVDRALELEPGHLSLYCFIPEPGTAMGDDVLAGRVELPSSTTQARMHDLGVARLARAGYRPYETANFCRPGQEARHNLVYWLSRPFIGLGPSAHGCLDGERYGNHDSLSRWATTLERGSSCEAMREPRDRYAHALEVVMLSLRLGCGLSRRDHDPETWQDVQEHFGAALDAAVAGGRLRRSRGGWRIAERHRFVADDIVAWVAARATSTPPAAIHAPADHGLAACVSSR
jgi:oxygen-independent coproporphyrinogen III oxidase